MNVYFFCFEAHTCKSHVSWTGGVLWKRHSCLNRECRGITKLSLNVPQVQNSNSSCIFARIILRFYCIMHVFFFTFELGVSYYVCVNVISQHFVCWYLHSKLCRHPAGYNLQSWNYLSRRFVEVDLTHPLSWK